MDEVSKLLIESRAEVKYLKTEKKTPPVIQLKEQQVIPQVTQLAIPKNEVVKVSKEEKEKKPRRKMTIEKFYEWIEKEYPPGDRLSFCNFIGIDKIVICFKLRPNAIWYIFISHIKQFFN